MRRVSACARIPASPAATFALVTDPARLPDWNAAITDVLDAPAHLEPGSVWKIRLHALGQTWASVSTVTTIDATSRRFAYRSKSDDGNPSYADWEWRVEPANEGSAVTVAVELNPLTFWRKHLLVRIRRPSLRREVEASLTALGGALVDDPTS
jgi:uncharacterized protein YndB with AHSA1/START domain